MSAINIKEINSYYMEYSLSKCMWQAHYSGALNEIG